MELNTLFILLINSIVLVNGKNIVLIIADDLDLVLDGMTPLQNTRNIIGNNGATFLNCFVASPLCCPNRASILTGRYQHNHQTFNNSLSGGCSSMKWQNTNEKHTFATILKTQKNYRTFYAGKYLNQYGTHSAGGPNHKPAGWDWWAGLVGNSKYYNYTLSVNGSAKFYGDKIKDYLTDVIAEMAVSFIRSSNNDAQPFLMVLAPPAPHAPFTPAVRHNDKFKETKAKHTPNFNSSPQMDKHWLVRMAPSPLPQEILPKLDFIFRRRWETLLSVDDLVVTIYETLRLQKVLNNTYIIFTSDNGYHIGQFSMPFDKRQPYESDIRVPLLIRGPEIPVSQVRTPVSSVDLFDTILHIAEIKEYSDGKSVLLKNVSHDRTVLIEYKGEKSIDHHNTTCMDDFDLNLYNCDKNMACKCEDSANNTYSCIRRFSDKYNNIFCIFEDNQHYIEAYDLNEDQYQMMNIGYKMNHSRRRRFRKRLNQMVKCIGSDCL
ncbi:N-acetylglucosamine-6-sulfatase-like isoform X1 [Microplitis mediator]|uniref:N-acetylglucosamine-6-sulfatase-like isoform X1 n=1 Tax=Microplitis mediator TaxID=375433 RepID=UPI002555EA10|nr:N-acetylglucosamine-6-sulfatase-like isoform X1 [Microplitis mediator]XP_057341447.1 N-acetylglucosamine-6-sulfatase-like isoform X1 [Microplitis mediator]XP_057341448.1 N-acetylglucosamine-6-sulfatase-like isoform X1 [Microplitis mediator]